MRLIRGENDNMSLGDTNRSQAMNSAIKGVNTSNGGQNLVRKVQTPQTFKCKQKPAKRSSQVKNQSQANIVFMNQSDFNPFTST